MMMCYVCEGNDYYGVDGEWRPEGESTQHETNVRLTVSVCIPTKAPTISLVCVCVCVCMVDGYAL